ncbi:MAG TPA: HAMP domain-containing sensor histidine kinase [Verrucomicrobiae bacterium]|nr:HAMP domain-containing sensor histidine kinase [Verrucomicrobiae bacterium]
MKKIALVFVTAVFVPSLVLAWLAVRSLRDQQLVLERQQYLLYQGVADALAKEADGFVTDQQHEFGQRAETLLAGGTTAEVTRLFDDRMRTNWPNALVTCAVTTQGEILSPQPNASPAAAAFYADFGKFLGNRESAQVYWNANKASANGGNGENNNSQAQNSLRNVVPQGNQAAEVQNYSKVASSETEFRQLVGDANEGTIARFVDNKLRVLLWHRSLHQTNLILGAELSMPRLKENLGTIVKGLDPALTNDIAVALLDDMATPVAVSRDGFHANWKRPFVATELAEALPHWEMAVYLLDPAKLAHSAHTLALTLGLLIFVLLLAIGVGGWLIVTDLNRQLTLARQKTDFVSNVSHELKTPLTSIRMFSELLAEGRVSEPEKRQSYLQIITAETSRLTRLINNVLDFSRMERGEKKYQMRPFDLAGLARETVETYRPHLESIGFKIEAELPETEIMVNGDRDALSQVLVNLLSNAEKYSNSAKAIAVELERIAGESRIEMRVLDRGPGVPRGCEERIFEQFYRAHDSLSSGIQGSGLGLTLARQIARAHGGDVIYRPREGGGSCFILSLPMEKQATRVNP